MRRAVAVCLASFAGGLGSASFARAAESEALLTASGAAGALTAEGAAAGLGGLDLWWGLDDWLWLDGGVQFGGAEAGGAWVSVGLGLAAALDVLAWVPWVEGRVAVLADGRPDVRPALELGLGVDRLLAERWWLGVFGRASLSTEVANGPTDAARGGPLIVGGIRLGLRWDL